MYKRIRENDTEKNVAQSRKITRTDEEYIVFCRQVEKSHAESPRRTAVKLKCFLSHENIDNFSACITSRRVLKKTISKLNQISPYYASLLINFILTEKSQRERLLWRVNAVADIIFLLDSDDEYIKKLSAYFLHLIRARICVRYKAFFHDMNKLSNGRSNYYLVDIFLNELNANSRKDYFYTSEGCKALVQLESFRNFYTKEIESILENNDGFDKFFYNYKVFHFFLSGLRELEVPYSKEIEKKFIASIFSRQHRVPLVNTSYELLDLLKIMSSEDAYKLAVLYTEDFDGSGLVCESVKTHFHFLNMIFRIFDEKEKIKVILEKTIYLVLKQKGTFERLYSVINRNINRMAKNLKCLNSQSVYLNIFEQPSIEEAIKAANEQTKKIQTSFIEIKKNICMIAQARRTGTSFFASQPKEIAMKIIAETADLPMFSEHEVTTIVRNSYSSFNRV